MKVALAAQGPDLKSPVDPYFGRARYFVVVDTESGEFSVHDNVRSVRFLTKPVTEESLLLAVRKCLELSH